MWRYIIISLLYYLSTFHSVCFTLLESNTPVCHYCFLLFVVDLHVCMSYKSVAQGVYTCIILYKSIYIFVYTFCFLF